MAGGRLNLGCNLVTLEQVSRRPKQEWSAMKTWWGGGETVFSTAEGTDITINIFYKYSGRNNCALSIVTSE